MSVKLPNYSYFALLILCTIFKETGLSARPIEDEKPDLVKQESDWPEHECEE
jgi:hypothetical protein